MQSENYMKLAKLLFLLFIYVPSVCGQTFAFRDQSEFVDGSERGKVVLKLENRVLSRSAISHAEYTFYVTNSSYSVYNWQFNLLIPLPGQLALYNEKKEYLGNIMLWETISRSAVTDKDWTFLFGGSHVGSKLGVCLSGIAQNLPAGKYSIQLILYRAFIALSPFRTEGQPIDFYKNFDKTELCRSNAIEIEIID